jgi:hypothetical protein
MSLSDEARAFVRVGDCQGGYGARARRLTLPPTSQDRCCVRSCVSVIARAATALARDA